MKKIYLSALFAVTGALVSLSTHATLTQTLLAVSDTDQLVNAAVAKANALNAKVCVAVVDQGGQLLAFKRMDNAPIGCIDASILKGRAAALYRTPTDKYMERANGKEPAIVTLPGLVPLGGGSPVKYQNTVIGAVGVSGSANPNEIAIAKAAADSFH